jgi:RNA polymerase-binding transcription factor DksA
MDEAVAIVDAHTERSIAAVRAASAQIERGQPGECASCGEDMPRLVGRLCAPCRDGRRRSNA